MAYFDLELHQIDAKIILLNDGGLLKTTYIKQPNGFQEKGKEHLVYKLKSLYIAQNKYLDNSISSLMRK